MITAPLPWATQGDSFLTKRLGLAALARPEVSGVLFAKGASGRDLEVTLEVRGHALTAQVREFTFTPYLSWEHRPAVRWVNWALVDLREGTDLTHTHGVLDLEVGLHLDASIPDLLALVPEG